MYYLFLTWTMSDKYTSATATELGCRGSNGWLGWCEGLKWTKWAWGCTRSGKGTEEIEAQTWRKWHEGDVKTCICKEHSYLNKKGQNILLLWNSLGINQERTCLITGTTIFDQTSITSKSSYSWAVWWHSIFSNSSINVPAYQSPHWSVCTA